MPTAPCPKAISLRSELLQIEPLIWRRVLVFNQWTLVSLYS